MRWTSTASIVVCAAIALVGVGCGFGPRDDGDGGADGGAVDGGGGDAGPAPVFLEGPALTAVTDTTATVTFRTSPETTASLQWRIAGLRSAESVDVPATDHRVELSALAPGRTLEVAVAVRSASGASAVASVSGRTAVRAGPRVRALFDAAHGQQAGNADWVVDTSGRFPSPSSPSRESDWDGAYSAYGVDLVRSGLVEVEVLTEGGRFAFGTGDAQDLQGYDVLVVPEPNELYTTAELDAVEAFVQAGGGLVLIANHGGSDRNNNGWDSVRALAPLLGRPGWGVGLVGDREDGPARISDEDEALADGPFGPVQVAGVFDGTTLRLDSSENPSLVQVAHIPGMGAVVARLSLGAGRVVVHGDSAAADDGTDSGGNANIFDSWTDPEQQNAALFLNATLWAAGRY